jgi:hypothetical protein
MVTGDQLAALCETLDTFVPTIPDEVVEFYLRKAGVNPSDKRVWVNQLHRPARAPRLSWPAQH